MDKLTNEFEDSIKELKSLLLFYPESKDQEYTCLRLKSQNAFSGIIKYTLNKDKDYFKQSFYRSSLIGLFSHLNFEPPGFYGGSNLFLTRHAFIYAVLSDSDSILQKYSQYDDNFLKTYSASLCKSIKAIFINDKELLSQEIEKLYKYTSKKGVIKYYAGIPIALEGILKEDKSLITKGVSEFLSTHKKQQHLVPGTEEYINLEALAILKLAYRKGLIIDFDHPLVPKELIPVVPLEKYEKYAFFDED